MKYESVKKTQKHLLTAMFNNGKVDRLTLFPKKSCVAFQPWILERYKPEKGYEFLIVSTNPQLKVYVPETKFSNLVEMGLLVYTSSEVVELTEEGKKMAEIWTNQRYIADRTR